MATARREASRVMTYVAGLLQPYPELIPVLSLARSTVTEALGLGEGDTDVILACERLGAEAPPKVRISTPHHPRRSDRDPSATGRPWRVLKPGH